MSGKLHPISMPKWGMEMTEGDVVEWHFEVGEQVTAGSELVDIETAKIVNTLNAYESGVLRRIIADSGDTYQVGQLLGVLSDGDASEAEVDEFVASFDPPEAVLETEPEVIQEEATDEVVPQQHIESVPQAPASVGNSQALEALAEGEDDSHLQTSTIARRMAKKYNVNLHKIRATGHHGRISKRDVETTVTQAGGVLQTLPAKSVNGFGPTVSSKNDDDVNASSVARRLAKKLNVNLHDCRTSGHHDRVCKADVEAAYALAGSIDHLGNNENPQMRKVRVGAPEVEEIPFSGMRKTIATRLQESKQAAPHFRTVIEVEMENLLTLRSELNSSSAHIKISVNDMLIKACGLALIEVPDVNIQFDGKAIKRFADADISVAVSLDDGLITPVVRNANRLTLPEIAAQTKDLAARAKSSQLTSEEVSGGTFTISNLGMFGVKQFDAIINPPQAAILAVGATEAKAIVKDGGLQFLQVLTLTLSSDHRVIDGALAAKYLQVLKTCLQHPQSLLG